MTIKALLNPQRNLINEGSPQELFSIHDAMLKGRPTSSSTVPNHQGLAETFKGAQKLFRPSTYTRSRSTSCPTIPNHQASCLKVPNTPPPHFLSGPPALCSAFRTHLRRPHMGNLNWAYQL